MQVEVTPLLLHIGFHKTGSSWLQQTLFSDPNSGFVLATGRARHCIVEDFVNPDLFDFSVDDTRRLYQLKIEAARQQRRTLVVSHERLSGYPASGGYDRKQIAERLVATFPEAKVLIVIREQTSLIYSFYSQYITDGGCLSLMNFLKWPPPQLGRMPYFRLSFYEFHSTIKMYQQLFGTDRVLVLPFEALRLSPDRFVDAICSFSGHPRPKETNFALINPRRSAIMQLTQRLANHLFSYSELNPIAPLPVDRFARKFSRLRYVFETLSPDWLESYMSRRAKMTIREAVGNHYARSNFLTQRAVGLSLKELGYSCSEAEGPDSDPYRE